MSQIRCRNCGHTEAYVAKTTDTMSTNGDLHECRKCRRRLNVADILEDPGPDEAVPTAQGQPKTPSQGAKPLPAVTDYIGRLAGTQGKALDKPEPPPKPQPEPQPKAQPKPPPKPQPVPQGSSKPEEIPTLKPLPTPKPKKPPTWEDVNLEDEVQLNKDFEDVTQEIAKKYGISVDLYKDDSEDSDDEDTGDAVDDEIKAIAFKQEKVPVSTSESVADAHLRLKEEAARFAAIKFDGKVLKKGTKIHLPNEQTEPKPDVDIADTLKGLNPFGKKKAKPDKPEKSDLEKADQVEAIGDPVGRAAAVGATLTKGMNIAGKAVTVPLNQVLDSTNTGDNIAASAIGIAAALGEIGQLLAEASTELAKYVKTDGAKATEHRNNASTALLKCVGSLTVLTKHTLGVVEGSGAMEAGAAVPILGIVLCLPALVMEINRLRSAITREARQRAIHAKLKQARENGTLEPSQQALDVALKSFIAADSEVIVKGITKVCLDFTKIAGHGVTLGGITAPVGIALTVGATVGKLVISGVDKAEDAWAAHQANEASAEKGNKPEQEIQNDPQLAAQIVLDRALAEDPGGPGSLILKSFGVKEKQLEAVRKDPHGEASTVAIRDMRQKVLSKLVKPDKAPKTTYRTLKGGVDGVKDVLSPDEQKKRLKEEAKYREAKDLLKVGGKDGRGKEWNLGRFFPKEASAVEEKKRILLAAFNQRVEQEGKRIEQEKDQTPLGQVKRLDDAWIEKVRDLLKES